MPKFIPNERHLWTALIFCFYLKKTAAESYQLLQEACGDHAPLQDTCEQWFWHFKSGDFNAVDREQKI